MKIINLLPKQKQAELKYEGIFRGVLELFWISMISFGLVFLAQFATKVYLQYMASTLDNNISQLTQVVNQQDNTTIKSQITAVNNEVGDFKNLSDSSPLWSHLLKAFVPLVPAGVRISNLSVNSQDKAVVIIGHSPTRDLVIQLYNNILSDSGHFTGIDYPLENVSKPADINFHFEFTVQDAVLH